MSSKLTGLTGRCSARVGLLVRRQFRHELNLMRELGVTYDEDKGLLDSFFIIRGPANHVLNVYNAIKRMERSSGG